MNQPVTNFLQGAGNIDLRYSTLTSVAGGIVYHDNDHTRDENVLATLRPVERRGYDVPECMEGTREDVFRKIDAWLDDVDTSNILWINGCPGSGKSAIASSLVSKLTMQRRHVSYFFFQRGHVSFGDPTNLWRTIAFDLARFNAGVRAYLVEFLKGSEIRDADIGLHFKSLVAAPLTKSIQELAISPPIIIIDALDECGSDDSRFAQLRHVLLETLTLWPKYVPAQIKLLVTSRDERLPRSFHDSTFCHHIILGAGSSVSPETQHDIRVFFQTSFNRIGSLGYPPPWPKESIIDQLTECAAGLFIWAKTAIAFIEEQGEESPNAKLQLILAGKWGEATNSIDILYHQILKFHFHKSCGALIKLFKPVVGTIIVAKEPLHCNDLLHFLIHHQNEDARHISDILRHLSSVISVGNNDGLLHLNHLSFSEFLSDCNRCSDNHFLVDQSKQHRRLALICLQLMNQKLRFNICDLKTSAQRNDEVVDLKSRIERSIPTYLLYACRFWAEHLQDSAYIKHDHKPVLKELRYFLYNQFLSWLEVLSLINEVSVAQIALLSVIHWLQTFDKELLAFAEDAHRFVVNFHVPISESAPHIYVSALPSSPQESKISKQYLHQFPNTLSLISGQKSNWNALTNIFTGHSQPVWAVAFSPNGKHVASGSGDNTICIWDTETGKIVSGPCQGHCNTVWSVSFSPNGQLVASASGDGKRYPSKTGDSTIRIWDVKTGRIVSGPFYGHEGTIWSVAFSPDGQALASGSSDNTIHIWDAQTGKTISGLGHTGVVWSVAFSPNGRNIVSGAEDNSVRIWDVQTCQTVFGPFRGQHGHFISVAFSPDARHVISGSGDQTIHIWDVLTGNAVLTPFRGHTDRVWSVAYSPDGNLIASASCDRTIRIWNAQTGQTILGPYNGHMGPITSVAFSPDGKHIVSGSEDETICIWEIHLDETLSGPIQAHNHGIWSVAFSPDGTQVVSGSSDKTVHIWDAKSCKTVLGPFQGHDNTVWSVAFSPDGKLIASASGDGKRYPSKTGDSTIHIWDVKTGRTVSSLLHGHEGTIWSVAFSPDGRHVVSGSSDHTICIWDIKTGKAVSRGHGHTGVVWSVAYAPSGKYIASGAEDNSVRVWNVQTCETVFGPFQGQHGHFISVAFSPDERHVISGSGDNTIHIWEVQTGKTVLAPFIGHTDCIWSVAYSPDGRLVASGSCDHTVRIWDAQTGQTILGPYNGHMGAITAVAFSPNGKQVVSGSEDKTIRIWDITACQTVSESFLLSNTFTINPSNGWATSPNTKDLLFWVPASSRGGLCVQDTMAIIGTHMTRLDFKKFVHGSSWENCHCPSMPHVEHFFVSELLHQWYVQVIILLLVLLLLLLLLLLWIRV